MRLIFADALLEDIEQTVRFSCREGVPSAEMRGANKIIDRIKAAPTISPDEVRGAGEWIYDDFDGDGIDYQCSCCKQYSRTNWNYCPSCGARMKGAEDGTTD